VVNQEPLVWQRTCNSLGFDEPAALCKLRTFRHVHAAVRGAVRAPNIGQRRRGIAAGAESRLARIFTTKWRGDPHLLRGHEVSRVMAIWWWMRRDNSARSAGLRLRVDPPSLRDSLREHLEASGCLVSVKSSDEIEAQLLNSVSERHDHQTLVGAVAAWERAHPAARVEFVAGRTG
jgi:hypothetical protein